MKAPICRAGMYVLWQKHESKYTDNSSGRYYIKQPEHSGSSSKSCAKMVIALISGLKFNHSIRTHPVPVARLVIRNRLLSRIVVDLIEKRQLWLYKLAARVITKRHQYDFVLGVDRQGVIEAAAFAHVHEVPYAMISYELLFEEEAGKQVKQLERIAACRDLLFAVCQDRERSKQLAYENDVAIDNIIDIPVSGRSVMRDSRSLKLHNEFDIPLNKKIALYAGSVATWTMIDEILNSLQYWPENWVLVLHCFAGMNEKMTAYVEKYRDLEKLFISCRPMVLKEMHQLMHSVDLGLALYKPRYPSIHTGKNIEYMGMSSGKISTYLQHGVPVLVNEIGEMADHVRDCHLGIVVKSPEEIPAALEKFDPELYRENCYRFFKEKLDLNTTITPLLDQLDMILSA